jgi:hypothetical protein
MSINKSFASHFNSKICRLFIITSFILFSIVKIDPVQSCEKIKPEIKIIDESRRLSYFNANLPESPDTLRNLPFKNFILSTSEKILPIIDRISQCDSEVKLYFVYSPFISDRKVSFQLFPSTGATRYLDSPWVKYAIGSSPKPFIHVAFFWNERQLILDQALMSGIAQSFTKISLSTFNYQDFIANAIEYSDSLSAIRNQPITLNQETILRKFTPDINWIFRNTRQFFVKPFYQDAEYTIYMTTEVVRDEYQSGHYYLWSIFEIRK